MNNGMPDAGVGFSLTVPPSWFELDLAPVTRDSVIASLVDERVRDQADLRPHRALIARLLRQQAREAWDAGARFCAAMVEPTDEGPITASVTVSIVPGPLGVSSEDPTYLDALLAPLTPKQARDVDDTWQVVKPVELQGDGAGARSWGVEDIDLPQDAGWVRVVQMLQLIPVPGSNRVVLVACSSPVLPLVDVLLDLFHAVCDTLRLVRAVPVDVIPSQAESS